MAMTKRGIYHNLKESEYATSNRGVALFFSSTFYLGKFLNEYHEHRQVFRERISRAMNVNNMNTDLLADITLYTEIEKRGFRAMIKQGSKWGDISWQNLHQFALESLTRKNTNDWYETPVQKLDG